MKPQGLTLKQINKIVDFIKRNSPYRDEEQICKIIKVHLSYRTCIIVWDEDKVVSVCRWNISKSGRVAEVLDLIIDKDYRRMGLIKRIIRQGKQMFPTIEVIGWNRRKVNFGYNFFNIHRLLGE